MASGEENPGRKSQFVDFFGSKDVTKQQKTNPMRGSNPRTYPIPVVGKIRDTTSPTGPLISGDFMISAELFSIYSLGSEARA
jgi:hypothetical protein